MNPAEINQVLAAQRNYFNSGVTLPVSFRIAMLKKLYEAVEGRKGAILAALTEDLGKSDYEGFMCEVGLSLTEISYMIGHTLFFGNFQKFNSFFCNQFFVRCNNALAFQKTTFNKIVGRV